MQTIIVPGGHTVDLRIGTGRVMFEKFYPRSDIQRPQDLFSPSISRRATPDVTRFIHRFNPAEFLIYTDGACLGNGTANPRAGCAFVFTPEQPGLVQWRLENRGPTGQRYEHTSNRAELRAVIGALRFQVWSGEGFNSLIIATDSEYVVNGATAWIRTWLRNGWKTKTGSPVKNKDLWQVLLGEAERWEDMGLGIQFWKISRDLNVEADYWAKQGANAEPISDSFVDLQGLVV